MTLSLREVLAHPALTPAEPVVRAGEDALGRLVRWVHSSEVLEIAALLRGGELLLTGGVVLGASDASGRRRYIHDLASREVAGVAIETGPELPELPPELLREAADLHFPVIELRRVVPFVTITEHINGFLVNESVRHLRAADELSRELSTALAAGAGLGELLGLLARALDCPVAMWDNAGHLLASGGNPGGAAGGLGAAAGAVSVPLSVHGAAAARLVVVPRGTADLPQWDPALDRVAEILALALARTGAVTPEGRAERELLRLLRSPGPGSDRVARLARAAGVPEPASVVGVVTGAGDVLSLGAVDAVLRRHGRRVTATVADGVLCGLVALSAGDGLAERARLVADLRALHRSAPLRIGVGPAVRSPARFAHAFGEAERCLAVADELGWPQRVVDASEAGVELLVHRATTAETLREFVHDQLGPVLAEPRRAGTLVATLEAYFRTGCSKTATARELHLQRQALYQRLTRAFELLGGDPAGTPRAASIHLAARLYTSGLLRE